MPRQRIAIVAGEPSGDLLGAYIVEALKVIFPDAEFVGVAGERMLQAGVKTLFPQSKIAVMGFTEVLARLVEILSLRRLVKRTFLKSSPDVYIGIDSPDFNLPIEKALKQKNIKTVHCCSPTIWAWRENRIHGIKKAVNLMLLLFPFESEYYTRAQIPSAYIGHPLADLIPLEYTPIQKIQHIALLPGSRAGEIKYIAPVLIQSAEMLLSRLSDYPKAKLTFWVPCVNQERLLQFNSILSRFSPSLQENIKLSVGDSREIMAKSDLVILASGTATLEAMLLKKPMIVVYKGSGLSFKIAKKLIKINHIALPNILCEKKCVPELLQEQATPENIVREVEKYQTSSEAIKKLQLDFLKIHQLLRCDAAKKAASAIAALMTSP